MTEKARYDVLDAMKGIGIILMVVGHMIVQPIASNYIYSFHMPLFFFVAGFLFKPVPVLTQLKKDAKRLLLPFLIGKAFILFYGLLVDYYDDRSTHIDLLEMIDGADPLWFLLAIFWAKSIFNALHKFLRGGEQTILFGLIVVLLSLSAYYFHSYPHIYIPLKLTIGLGCMLFYYMGYLLRRYNVLQQNVPHWLTALLCFTWLIVAPFTKTSLATLYFSFSLLPNLLIGLLGTYTAYFGAQSIGKYSMKTYQQLLYWGKNSLVVLFLHSILYYFMVGSHFPVMETIFNALRLPLIGETTIGWGVHFLFLYIATQLLSRSKIGKAIFG